MNRDTRKVPLPKEKYISKIEINDEGLLLSYKRKKKVALLLIGVNERYWPYLNQVIKDAREHFLPQHKVDFHVWSDMPEGTIENVFHHPTDSIEWPYPTLMRYHLFLNEEEKLKEYDYLFYLDADMRIVAKISDEILGEGLTTAPHPGYAVNPLYIPPYEPNKDSRAYIPRLGRLVTENSGKTRFMPFYAAGGFQGGVAREFLKAMKELKRNIDWDLDHLNYIAIWNDESHWNKYLWDFQRKEGNITFLDVSYIYPDSLIKEYYEPLWGRKYDPKIITITKPFSLSKQAAEELNQLMGKPATPVSHLPSLDKCTECGQTLNAPGFRILRVHQCLGLGKDHQLEMVKL